MKERQINDAHSAIIKNWEIQRGETMDNQLDYEINKELGECYLFMGDFDKAEEYYRKAASANSKARLRSWAWLLWPCSAQNWDKALVLYQKAATIEETDKTLCGIGLVHMEKGEHTEAFDYFTRALEKSSGNLVALNCMVREALSDKPG